MPALESSLRAHLNVRAAVATLFLAASLWLSGCAVGPHFEKPQLKVAGADLIDGNFNEQHIRVRVHAYNPNGIDLPIRAINYQLELAGEPLGHGQTDAAFVVPAKGDTEFSMTVTTHLGSVLLKLLPRLKEGGRGLDYRVTGTIRTRLAFFPEFAFDERGKF
jgi:LEA14-like dessication related protein